MFSKGNCLMFLPITLLHAINFDFKNSKESCQIRLCLTKCKKNCQKDLPGIYMTSYCTAMLHGGLEDSSDSEGEEKEDSTKTTLQFDDWLSFKLDNEVGTK